VVGGLVLLPDGQLASSSWDGTVRVWNLESGTQSMVMHTFQKVYALAVQSDGQLVSCSADHTLRVWDSTSGACLSYAQVGAIITAITAMPDGNLAMASTDGKLRVWDVSIGAFSKTLASLYLSRSALVGFPDSSLVLGNGGWMSNNSDINLQVWDANSGGLLEMGLPARNQIAMVALPDGGLVTASNSYQLHVWE
jgi:WD40 repeat protein